MPDNIWPTEPRMELMDVTETHNEKAEKLLKETLLT